MNRRQYLRGLAAGATVAAAGCSSLGGGGGSTTTTAATPNTKLPKPDLRADPADLPYPGWGQKLPTATVPAALRDTAVTTTDFDTPLALTFIYTNCQTACPVLTLALKRAQEDAAANGYGDRVNFVEMSFDPARDTPEALRKYAQDRHVDLDAGNWYFLLPESEARAKEVVQEKFGLAFMKTTPEEMDTYMFTHSTIILLVNADGYVERAYRDRDAATTQLTKDMQRLVDA